MFPAEQLTAAGGEIYCHLFENEHTGLARNIHWSFTIDFHPITHDGEELTCAMTCEWLTMPLRDWRDLAGQSFDLKYGDGGSESSFYLWEHHCGTSTRMRVGARDGSRFDVEMEMLVDFSDDSADDSNPAMTVRGRAVLPFAGVIVVPENLSPKLVTPADVRSAVDRYLDTALLREPELRGHAFGLDPLAGI